MRKILALLVLLGLSIALAKASRPQDEPQGAKQDMKDAGHETKKAAKKTGSAVEKGTKKVGHKSEGAAKKTGSAVEKGTKKAGHEVKKGTEKVAGKTEPQ